jgi:hypothetical protein
MERYGRGEFAKRTTTTEAADTVHTRIVFALVLADHVPTCVTTLEAQLGELPARTDCTNVRTVIRGWARNHHLTSDAVVATILAELLGSRSNATRCWNAGLKDRRAFATTPFPEFPTGVFRFEYPSVDLAYEATLPGWKADVQQAFEAALDERVAAVRARYEAERWHKTHGIQDADYSPLKTALVQCKIPPAAWGGAVIAVDQRHLEWLARYQCGNESHARIARHPLLLPEITSRYPDRAEAVRDAVGAAYPFHRTTVRDGIHEAARLVGLKVRPPARGGRPRKSGTP